jgi:hypothetical protein
MKIVTFVVVGLSIALAGADHARAIPATGKLAPIYSDEPLSLVPAQYEWGGQPYCWYFEGWRGPGWYRCGRPWRRGYGWGGGYGWRGWEVPGWQSSPYGRRHDWGYRERRRDFDDGGRRGWGGDNRGERRDWRDGGGERDGRDEQWRGGGRGRHDSGWDG